MFGAICFFFLLCWFGKFLADGQYRGLSSKGLVRFPSLANFFLLCFFLNHARVVVVEICLERLLSLRG
jgi:hypothetical protein